MTRSPVLVALVLVACGASQPPHSPTEEERMLLVRAGTAPPEPGRQTWGSSSDATRDTRPHDDVATHTAPPPPPPADGTALTGRASFYSDRLAGHRTASGEPYDPAALTAASRDLPLGTRVRVTRVQTGASVVVRINDRGPFGDHGRILDLSRAAAQQLDMLRAGVVDVTAEVLGE